MKSLPLITSLVFLGATPASFARDVDTKFFAQKGLRAIELLDGWQTPQGTHMVAVRITLDQGWKTYWRAPGAAGLPPKFTWKGSKNIGSVKFHWPSPKVYDDQGVRTVGYKDQLVLPIQITPKVKGAPITVKIKINYGICSDVCIPVTSKLTGKLDNSVPHNQQVIGAALKSRPKSAAQAGIKSATCEITPTSDGFSINATIKFRANGATVKHSVIEYSAPNVWIDTATTKHTGKTVYASAELLSYSKVPVFIDRKNLRITLINNARAIQIDGCPAPS